jgi:hypothetical protein
LQKADILSDTVNREDAFDVDENDGKLTKLSNASDQVSETIVSDEIVTLFINAGYKTFLRFLVMLAKL